MHNENKDVGNNICPNSSGACELSTLKALFPCPETLDFCLFEMDTGRVDFGAEKERMRIKVITASIYMSFVHNGFKLNTNLVLFTFN